MERQLITSEEYDILAVASRMSEIQNANIAHLFPAKSPASISQKIRTLVDRNMLMPIAQGKRKYTLRFDNNYLLRGIIHALDKEGFLPIKEQ